MRLIFMGAPSFAVPTLRALHAAGHEIAAVYTQPPRPAGRGKRPTPTPVAAAAEALGLSTRTPASLKDPAEQAAFAAVGADAAVVAAYGLILPRAVLDAVPLGCWNLHASLLPRWRGAAPVQRAIMAGDAETGLCVMRMAPGLDTGPVAMTRRTPIGPDETAGALTERLAALGAPLMVEAMAALAAGRLAATPQPETGATYAAKIDKAEARVDWTLPAAEIARRIRGLAPAPGAWTTLNGERLRLLAATVEPRGGGPETPPPGALLDDRLLAACGADALRITTAQREGRAALPAAELLLGLAAPAGSVLS
jgi:methionyl-tRNA formyltransferase